LAIIPHTSKSIASYSTVAKLIYGPELMFSPDKRLTLLCNGLKAAKESEEVSDPVLDNTAISDFIHAKPLRTVDYCITQRQGTAQAAFITVSLDGRPSRCSLALPFMYAVPSSNRVSCLSQVSNLHPKLALCTYLCSCI
jgi:hypothetical protein